MGNIEHDVKTTSNAALSTMLRCSVLRLVFCLTQSGTKFKAVRKKKKKKNPTQKRRFVVFLGLKRYFIQRSLSHSFNKSPFSSFCKCLPVSDKNNCVSYANSRHLLVAKEIFHISNVRIPLSRYPNFDFDKRCIIFSPITLATLRTIKHDHIQRENG